MNINKLLRDLQLYNRKAERLLHGVIKDKDNESWRVIDEKRDRGRENKRERLSVYVCGDIRVGGVR